MNKEQVQIIASALHFELGDPELAQKVENATHVFVYSSSADRLLKAAVQGDWHHALSLATTIVPSNLVDTAIFEIESCHVLETLLTKGGAAAMEVIQNSARPEHASQLGLLLFHPQMSSIGMRQRLHNRLRLMMGPQHTVPYGRLSELLRAALQFRNLEELGRADIDTPTLVQSVNVACGPGDRDAAECLVKAYVLESVASLSLASPARSLEDLKALCEVAPCLNMFGNGSINNMIQAVIERALDEDRTTAIQLMRGRLSAPHDLIEQSFSSITAGAEEGKNTSPAYNYLERYEQRRSPGMPICESDLHLGQVVEAVLNKFTPRIPSQSLFSPIKDQPSQFPNQIIQKLRLESEVWVVEFNQNGTRLAVACSNGAIILYSVDMDRFKVARVETMHLSNGAHRIAWHPDGTKLLVEDTEGFAVMWDTVAGTQVPIMPRQVAETSATCGGGDMCWHPTDPSLFFRVEWDHTLSLRYTNGEDFKWWCSLGEPLESVTPTADKRLAVLTAKTDEVPQRILVFDNYDAPSTAEEFMLPYADSQYSSLQCSNWDPRTLLLMGPNKAALILDLEGKRDAVALKGPIQSEGIIRPKFSGPMDKYVLCGSEEKEPAVAWVFNRFTGDVVARFHDHRDMVNSMSMHAGEKMALLATGSDDMDVIIYSSRTKYSEDNPDDASNTSDDDNDDDDDDEGSMTSLSSLTRRRN